MAMVEGFAEFHTPVQFNQLLSFAGLVDDVYKAMSSPDVSDVVMTIMDAMKRTNTMPLKTKLHKSAEKSTNFRNKGNQAYAKSEYQEALVHYNMALLLAPNNSRELKLAYGNRSALLHTVKAFSKCMKDIETVISLGVPDDIKDKLNQRYLDARQYLWIDDMSNNLNHPSFARSYFKFNGEKNPQIPSASTNISVIVENNMPKIVATNNVKVGVVLAIEPAFASVAAPGNHKICCYYCQKFDLNLMPCDSCCIALFCSEKCREICFKEYHSIECQVMDTLELIANKNMSMPRITVKCVLKIMNLSKDWEEFVAESKILGLERMKESSVNKIYDVNHKYSLLNSMDKRHFLHGALYNASIICAATIHTLESVKLFPQKSADRDAVKRAFARTYMHVYLHSGITLMIPAVSCSKEKRTEYFHISNYAFFSFLGKLKKSCRPNCRMFNLNKSMALVATQPIKCGEELTVSNNDPSNYEDPKLQQRRLFGTQGNICRCKHCFTSDIPKQTPLNLGQRLKLDELGVEELRIDYNPSNCEKLFMKSCKVMTILSTAQISEEYEAAYCLFNRCILSSQNFICQNKLMDCRI